jgi:Phage integrase family
MGQWSYKSAFDTAQRESRVTCRFYDARHTFVTRLAENPAISIETIRQLAGHVNDRMLARYAHIRVQERRDAIAALEKNRVEGFPSADERGWAQNWGAPGKLGEGGGHERGNLKPSVGTQQRFNSARKGWPAIRKRVLRGGGAIHAAKRRQRVCGPWD